MGSAMVLLDRVLLSSYRLSIVSDSGIARFCVLSAWISCYYYPAPGKGTRFLFSIDFFVSLFVSLSATLRENGWIDLHEIFREGVE